MSDKIISKRCSKCKEIKPLSEFYEAKGNRDGFSNNCKVCRSKYIKEYNQTERGKATRKHYRKSEKGKATRKRYEQSEKGKAAIKCYNQSENHRVAIKQFKIRHPERFKAHDAVNIAIRTGQLPRPDSLQCHYCPAQAKEYHHWHGYKPEHWLDVIPVCKKCHNKIPKNSVRSTPSLTA